MKMEEEEEFGKMLTHLQQYVPPLEKLILQLKDPKRKNRELQLSKLEGLHSMITDKRKKLKLDTLKKCEDVILKILQKVQKPSVSEQTISVNPMKFVCKNPPEDTSMALIQLNKNEDANLLRLKMARAKLSEIYTPASPSPPRNLPRNHSPVLIPAEKISSNGSYEKPNIYRLAAKSLIGPNPRNLFDEIGPNIDMSQPPLSEEDLLLLTEPERELYFEETSNLSISELENLRTTIQQKLNDTDDKFTSTNKSKLLKNNSLTSNAIAGNEIFTSKKGNAHYKSSTKYIPSAIYKVTAPQPVPPPQLVPPPPKTKTSTRLETVLKNPNSMFGDLLSSIDEQILKDGTKRKDKKIIEDPRRKSVEKKNEKDKTELINAHEQKIFLCNAKSDTNKDAGKHESSNPIPSPPIYKRLADKYNRKPRKPSIELCERTQLQEVVSKSPSAIGSPIETCTKPTDRDQNLELLCDKSNLALGIPSNHIKPISTARSSQYLPKINSGVPTTFNFTGGTQNHFLSSPSNQCIARPTNYPSPQTMYPHQSSMMPVQNMMMMPTQNVMTQHNSGGNTYMNTYIVQNTVSNDVTTGHFNNTYNNQMIPRKSFNPFQPIDNNEVPRNDYYHSQNNYIGYSQNKHNHINVASNDPRNAMYRDTRDRPFENNIRHDRPSREITNVRSVQNNRDPRIRNKPSSHERFGRCSIEHSNQNKYDSLYSNLEKDTEKFVSPLDSLYSGRESLKSAGKGYGFQRFRIPKKNEIPVKEKGDFKINNFKEKGNEENVDEVTKDSDDEVITKERTRCKVIRSPSPSPTISTLNSDAEVKATSSDSEGFESESHTVKRAVTSKNKNTSAEEKQLKNKKGNKIIAEERKSEQSLKANTVEQAEDKTETPAMTEESLPTKEDKKVDTALSSETKGEDDKATANEEAIIASYLAGLFQKANKEELLSVILSSLAGGTVEQQRKKFKQIQKIVESDSIEDDDVDTAESKVSKDTTLKEFKPETIRTSDETTKLESETMNAEEEAIIVSNDSIKIDTQTEIDNKSALSDLSESKIVNDNIQKETELSEELEECFLTAVQSSKEVNKPKAKKRKNMKKKSKASSSTSSLEQSEQVVESVGERTKNRKRSPVAPVKKGRKYRSELDMLHDDIKEMFICDGILTATGKRMCRLLKTDHSEDSKKKVCSKSIDGESTSTSLDSPKRRARSSNPKVLIEKQDFTKLVSVTPKSDGDKSETESVQSVPESKRSSRQVRKVVNSSASESSLKISVRKFPKRKIKNKPNYFEDPLDVSVSKESESENHEESETNLQTIINETLPTENDEMNIDDLLDKSFSSLTSESAESEQGKITKMTLNQKLKKQKLKLIKKKKPSWSLGVIKKKKRLSLSNVSNNSGNNGSDTENKIENISVTSSELPSEGTNVTQENDTVLVEPDPKYYFDPHQKSSCRICSFKGKFIVQHYRTLHPNYEVMISRIAPEEIKLAIAESIDNNYEEIDLLSSKGTSEKKNCTYKCRFCYTFFKNEMPETFFDHLTGHTGEYRFACTMCMFKTSSNKCLRSHYYSAHSANLGKTGTIVPMYKIPSTFYIVFGYVCSECHYIQLDRTAIENHMQIYHLGDNNRIFRINMSMITVKKPTTSTDDDQKEHINKVDDMDKPQIKLDKSENLKSRKEKCDLKVVTEKGLITEPKKFDEPLTILEFDKIKTEVINEPMDAVSSDNITPNSFEDLLHESSNAVSEVGPFRLMEPPQTIENISIFQDPSEFDSNMCKSEKITDFPIIFPKRCSFNLLAKIRSRLEETELDDGKEDQTGDHNRGNKETTESIIKEDINKPSCSYASSESTAQSTPNISAVDVRDVVASSLTEGSQGKHSIAVVQNPLDEKLSVPKTEDMILQVGPITATKRVDSILYSCNVSGCTYTTTVANDFSVHCINYHCDYQWNQCCNVCGAVLKHCGFKVADAHKHLLTHLNFNEIKNEQLPTNNDDDTQSDGDGLGVTAVFDTPFKIVSVETEIEEPGPATHNFPFLLTDFRTLSSDESENSNVATTKKKEKDVVAKSFSGMNSTAASGTSNTVASNSLGKMQTPVHDTLPALVPFTKSTLPALVPVTKTSSLKINELPYKAAPTTLSKKILLRDTPLENMELMNPRKSTIAMSALLTETKLAHLYKCPNFECVFSTDFKRSFINHLNCHSDVPRDMQIPCLYCNYKTEFANIAIHYDVRHAKCTYCCIYCLYRAVNQPYVEIHQEIKHPFLPRCVLNVPTNQDAMLSQANIALLPIKDAVPPFLCCCEKKFIFESDLLQHIKTQHHGILTCGYCFQIVPNSESLSVHMQLHNVYSHHCRYCVFGSSNTDDIYKHLSEKHFAYAPQIIMRRFDPSKVDVKTIPNYSYDDHEVLNYLKVITKNCFKYFTPSARKDITATPSQPVKRVFKLANVGLTVLADASASPDKILERTQQSSRCNSPAIITKSFDTSSIGISSTISGGGVLKTYEAANVSTPIVSIDINQPTLNTGKKYKEPTHSESTAIAVDKGSDKMDTSTVESDISLENSMGEVMDLALSESGEIHFSDLTPAESLFTQCSTKKLGLSGIDLFKCGYCKVGFAASREYRLHMINCVELNKVSGLKPFKCAHCAKAFKNINGVTEHLRMHGTSRFACSLCEYKAQHPFCVRQHMKTKHKVISVTVMPVDRNKQDIDSDEFIIKPKSNRQKPSESSGSFTGNHLDKYSVEKLTFTPEEMDLLPFRPIFPRPLSCAVCSYSTKVKANLLRHLQLHLKEETLPVPTTAPINPVPCLEKNEKMFDKMTNLSHSGYNSNSSRMSSKTDKKKLLLTELSKEEQEQIPSFVPSTKRNVCGAMGCNYLCLDDTMFKCHLAALHGSETFYKCKHCEVVLSTDGLIDVDSIIKHQKLHDLCLYKCKYCLYLYNVKHKVESHIAEAHSDKNVDVVVIREMAHEPIDTTNYERENEREEIKDSKPWRCGMCKYRCSAKNEIVAHILNKHELNEEQYKCALCAFRSNATNTFASHFDTYHAGHAIDVIDVYYKVDEESFGDKAVFDTTPIWKLNRNSKYIRGIPLEGSKLAKKFVVKPVSDSIEKSIESVVISASNVSQKLKLENNVDSVLIIDGSPEKIPQRREGAAKDLTISKEQDIVHVSDIIEIDDDISDTRKIGTSGDDDSMTLEKIEKIDVVTLMELNLSSPKYGAYGRPFHKKFLCPRCKTFRTKMVKDLTNHLYKELNYFKFICTICRLYGVTYNFLSIHSKHKHPGRPESIYPLSPDNEIEDYVSKVIAVQSRLMSTNGPLSVSKVIIPEESVASSVVQEASSTTSIETESTPLIKTQTQVNNCPHCSYSSKNSSDLRKHEKRHWLQKPLKCGHCDVEGVTNYEISVHCKRVHANLEPSIITMPTPSSPTIQPIMRKRKRRTLTPSNIIISDTFTTNKDSVLTLDTSHSLVEDYYVYLCQYCRKKCNTQFEIESHCNIYHSPRQIKFKKVLSSQVPKKHSINYKCFYCDFIGSLDAIKHHFKMDHPAQNLSVFRYQCSYCNEYFRKLEKIKAHCKQLHDDEDPQNIDIKLNAEPELTKEFLCDICNLQFYEEQGLLDHQQNVHTSNVQLTASGEVKDVEKEKSADVPWPMKVQKIEEKRKYKCPECSHTSNSYPSILDHLRIHVRPSQCGYCTARFIYPMHVKAHCLKEHADMPIKHITIEGSAKMLEALRIKLLVLENDKYTLFSEVKKKIKRKNIKISSHNLDSKRARLEGTTKPTARKSTTQVLVVKETARKSTTQSIPVIELEDDDVEDEGFSYYGTSPHMEGIDDLETTISLLDKMVTMNVKQFSSLVDIFPTVPVLNIFNLDHP